MVSNVAETPTASRNLIFGIVILLFGSTQRLAALQSDNSSCKVLEAKPIKGKRPALTVIEKSCVSQIWECFYKCNKKSSCLSFGIGRGECHGSLQCLLYPKTELDRMRHNKDSNHDYYVMGPPTCCVEPCTNKKVCREEDCQCACPEGYLSYRCMCSKKNLARIFRKNTPVMLSDDMKQVESGSHTWGIKDDQSLWALINDQWVDQSDKMRYISNGKAGTWGIRPDYNVLVRDGEKWKSIPSSHQVFVQIDSGSSGVVFGVNDANEIYCRSNITMHSPYGSNWVKVPGTAKHVSCGDYGCWIVRPDDTVAFRENVTVKHCTGTGWIERSGKFVQLDSGRTGSVYGIAKNGTLHRLHGICEKVPMGQNIWTEILTVRFKHVTVGDTNMYAIAENGTVFKFFP